MTISPSEEKIVTKPRDQPAETTSERNADNVVREGVPRTELATNVLVHIVREKVPPLFRTQVEQLLAMATPAEPGLGVPPLPIAEGDDLSGDLKAALANIIVADSNDTIRTLEIKTNVAGQKEEFIRLRDTEGWTIKEYLEALQEKFADEAKYLEEAYALDEENYNNSTMTDAEFLEQRKLINDELRSRGLPEITSSDRDKKEHHE